MRLICPNCDAQYEVPDAAIPAQGRDVQCSTCNNTWFQYHPEHVPQPARPEPDDVISKPQVSTDPEPEEESAASIPDTPLEDEKGSTETAPEAPRKELDPEVIDILREEAQRENEVRTQEAQARQHQDSQNVKSAPPKIKSPIKEVPEDILDTLAELEKKAEIQKSISTEHTQEYPKEHVRKLLKRIESLRGSDIETYTFTKPVAQPYDDAEQKSGRELLPDIEEISSTLRSTNERRMFEILSHNSSKRKKRRKFRRGVRGGVLCVAVLVGLYLFAPVLARIMPPIQPVLSNYVFMINQQRDNLDSGLRSTAEWLNATADNQSDIE